MFVTFQVPLDYRCNCTSKYAMVISYCESDSESESESSESESESESEFSECLLEELGKELLSYIVTY